MSLTLIKEPTMKLETKDMKKIINLVPVPGDKYSLYEFGQEAKRFIHSHKWVERVFDGYLAKGFEGVLGIFYFEVLPKSKKLDSEIWVIAGDLPPAYFSTDYCPTPVNALDSYICEMRMWISAVKRGDPVDELIPVNVPAEPKYAQILKERLDFLEKNIVKGMR
jgi:hypothetical protein